MSYLLDTNACIALINGRRAGVRARLMSAVEAGARVSASSVVSFELWYGAAKSQRVISNNERLRAFFSGPIDLVPFDDEDARAAGQIRATLEAAGTPIGAYDLLIAGQALTRGLTLVTTNVREFARVDGLRWEDWG